MIRFKTDFSEIALKCQSQNSSRYCSPVICCRIVDKFDMSLVIQKFHFSFRAAIS